MKIQINITGNAYFEVKRPDAMIVYTMGRLFHVRNDGILVTEEDYIILNQITVPLPFDEPIIISETGVVTALVGNTWLSLGQILVVIFEHPELLENLGDGYFLPTIGSGTPTIGTAGVPPFENVKIYYFNEAGRKHRAVAVLNVPEAIGDFIMKARKIVKLMSDNRLLYFFAPIPTMVQVTSDIDLLEAAETQASLHITGSAATRDQAYDALLTDLHGLQLYVQVIADNADDMLTAISIIESSGLEVKQHGVHIKDELSAKNSTVSGTVRLMAKAVKGAGAYEWQMTRDDIARSDVIPDWIMLPVTIDAHNDIGGLTPNTTVYFRCRAITKDGPENWTQAVSIIVT